MDLTGNQHEGYSFPLLKIPEILQCMVDLGVDLNEDDLTEPSRHRDRVRAAFIVLIEVGLNLSEKDLFTLSDLTVEKRNTLPYPELHEESVSEIKLLKACMKLMKICGVHDFGWKDLHSPSPKRFRRQLSGIINLAKFRTDRLQLYDELNEQRRELLIGYEEVKNEQVELTKQLEDTRIATDKKWKEIEEVENECTEIKAEIAQQNKIQASLRQESTELKKKANDLKDKIATTALALQEAEAEERKLSSQIVKSPDRIKGEMLVATKTLETERSECTKAEREAQEGKAKVANVIQAEIDVIRAIKVMNEAKEEKMKYESVMEEVKTAESKIANNQRKVQELTEERENLERELHRLEEKIAHMQKQGKIKMAAAQDALQAAQANLLAVEKDREEGMARVEAGEAEVRSIEAKIEEEKRRNETEIAEMIKKFHEFELVALEKDRKLMAELVVQ